MSLKIGLYDVFSYALPGFLFLLVTGAAVYLVGGPDYFVNIDEWINIPSILILSCISFVLGHIVAPLAEWNPWYLLFSDRKASAAAFHDVRETYPDIDITFEAEHWPLLQADIALHNILLTEGPDKLRATHMMLRSISLLLVLMAVFLAYYCVLVAKYWALAGLLACVFLSAIAAMSSHKYSKWSYKLVFEYALAKNGCALGVAERRT